MSTQAWGSAGWPGRVARQSDKSQRITSAAWFSCALVGSGQIIVAGVSAVIGIGLSEEAGVADGSQSSCRHTSRVGGNDSNSPQRVHLTLRAPIAPVTVLISLRNAPMPPKNELSCVDVRTASGGRVEFRLTVALEPANRMRAVLPSVILTLPQDGRGTGFMLNC
eukprot:scpid91971/ scgid16325/ 